MSTTDFLLAVLACTLLILSAYQNSMATRKCIKLNV